jgi:hypothetical protein
MQCPIGKLAPAFALLFCTLNADARDPQLIRTGPGQRIEPRRAASFTIENGQVVLTSDWIALDGARPRAQFQYVYDCFESDTTDIESLVPWDNSPGCQATVPPGTRWQLPRGLNNSFVAADLTTPAAGAFCEGLVHAWNWTVGAAEPDRDGDGLPDAYCYLAVQQFEDMDTSGCSDDGSSFIDGIIYDTGLLASSVTYYYFAVNLSGTGLWHSMPADGVGGYQLAYIIRFPPGGSFPELAGGIDDTQQGVSAQPMLWGTADAEPVNDGRAGSQNAWQFDDMHPSDGIHDADECINYAWSTCPTPLGAMTGFLVLVPPCPCRGDANGDGRVDIGDLVLLLSSFGESDPTEPCIDSDADADVDLQDLAFLLHRFGQSCP